MASADDEDGDWCRNISYNRDELEQEPPLEKDGCTFMCGKVSVKRIGKQSDDVQMTCDCIFGCFKRFKELVEFSKMSLISGFQEYLFKEWCDADMVVFHDPYTELSTLIDYYKLALEYEERLPEKHATLGIYIPLSDYDYDFNSMHSMKERCECVFISNVKKYRSESIELSYFSTGDTTLLLSGN